MIQYLKYKFIVTFNSFIYFLQHIPLMKHVISDKCYRADKTKKFYAVIALFEIILKKMISTAIYFLIFYALTGLIFKKYQIDFNTHILLYLYAVLNIIGVVINTKSTLAFNIDKYHLIKTLKLKCRTIVLVDLMLDCVTRTFAFFVFLSITKQISGLSIYQIAILVLFNIIAKVFYEYLSLALYHHYAINSQDTKIVLPLTFILAIVSYTPIALRLNLSFSQYLFSIWFFIIMLVIAIYALTSLLRYDYHALTKKALRYEPLLEAESLMKNATFLDAKNATENIDNTLKRDVEHLKDYDYIHAIFFDRFHKKINRPIIKYTLLYMVLIALVYVITYFKIWQLPQDSMLVYTKFLSGFLLITSFVNYGTTYVKMLFYHMDQNFLPYPFYRKIAAIFKCLKIRFKYLFILLLIPNLVIMIGASLYFTIFFSDIGIYQIAFISLWVLGTSMFFGLNQLFIYYIFQPFSIDGIKLSLPAKINQAIIASLAFIVFRLRIDSFYPFIVILVFMLLYNMLLIYFTTKLAITNFKI